MKLPTVAETDKAIRDHLETTHIFDAKTGDFWKPVSVPPDPSPDPTEPEPDA